MKSIRFVNKDRSQFAAVLRKNVNNYFKEKGISSKGSTRMLFKSTSIILFYLAPFVLLLTLPLSGWTIFPLSVAMGLGMAGIGMGVMHDAVHGSFSNKAWVNKLFGNSMYLIGGNIFTWKVQHNVMHHTFTNIEGFDEDIHSSSSLRLSKHSPLKKVHRFQHIYAFFLYCLMTIARVFRDFGQLRGYNKTGVTQKMGTTPAREMTRMIITKAIYLFVIIGFPFLFSGFSWWLIVLGFLVMHFTAGVFMSTVFQMAHIVEEASQPQPNSEGVIETEWMIHEMATTANFGRKSRFLGWITGGLNCQVEHHLFPNICHVHYRAISPIVKRTASEFGLPYNENRTFLIAVRSHFRMLKALGR